MDITKGKGSRVTILSMADGSAFDADAIYTVALTSYRASGGGYLLEQGAGIAKDEIADRIVARYADIREILYDKIQADGFLSYSYLIVRRRRHRHRNQFQDLGPPIFLNANSLDLIFHVDSLKINAEPLKQLT